MSVLHDETKTPADPEQQSLRRTGRATAVLESVWAERRRGMAATAVLATASALVGAFLTPRGPITTGEALATMFVALLVGACAGLLTGTRWSLLVAPLAYITVFELARLGIEGPTVDLPNLGSMYGVLALVLGRGLHGLLAVAPMILGGVYGIWLSARLGNQSTAAMGGLGRTATGLATIAMAALVLAVARPASTAPILGPGDGPPSGSIAELATVDIGGHDQVMMIRGRSVDSPVLLYLSGGPGGTDLGALRADVSLEQEFVVAAWDQRGAGKSYAALDPTNTFTVDQLVDDTIEVTNYLRERFNQDQIFLVGQSWGSTLGALAAQSRPDLYYAFVGVGQMVSQRESDIMFWEDALSWANETGNSDLADALRGNGSPPYEDLHQYAPIIQHEHDWNPYPELDLSNEMPAILFVPEYNLMDRLNAFRGFLDTAGVLYPQLQGIDFRNDVPGLQVPYYMVLGEHEARGRAVLAEEWYETLRAPVKERVIVEGAGHRAHFDRPDVFTDLMRQVLRETYPAD